MGKDGTPEKLTLYTMYEAVRSPIAENLWSTGKSEQPSTKSLDLPVKMQYVIEFP